jgi:hypothetical protein
MGDGPEMWAGFIPMLLVLDLLRVLPQAAPGYGRVPARAQAESYGQVSLSGN